MTLLKISKLIMSWRELVPDFHSAIKNSRDMTFRTDVFWNETFLVKTTFTVGFWTMEK